MKEHDKLIKRFADDLSAKGFKTIIVKPLSVETVESYAQRLHREHLKDIDAITLGYIGFSMFVVTSDDGIPISYNTIWQQVRQGASDATNDVLS